MFCARLGRPAVGFALLLLTSAATAQQWRQLTPGAVSAAAACFDPERNVMVVFGGTVTSAVPVRDGSSATWEWQGSDWVRVGENVPAPPVRFGAAMAYDPVHGGCLLFGGRSGSAIHTDTWRWDGRAWSQLTPAGAPPGGEGVRLATDWARARIVLAPSGGTTWEWDGSDWLPVAHAGSDPGRVPLAYDHTRGRVVAFAQGTLWEWDGARWMTFGTGGVVPNRTDHVLAHDPIRGHLLVCCGVVGGNYARDFWAWDGTSWQQRADVPAASGRSHHVGVFDRSRGRFVVFGGADWRGDHADVWEWDGLQWYAAEPSPVECFDPVMAGDSLGGRILLFSSGGSGQTFEWHDGKWNEQAPTTMPTEQHRGGLVFDSPRDVFVYFGGKRGSLLSSDTWEWSLGDWHQRQVVGPPARSSHAMAYDAARARIVVFGGRGASQIFDDTWEFDGTQWQQALPVTKPSWRELSGMAFEPIRQEVLMYGGLRGYTTLGDTWAWDGNDWIQRGSSLPREDFAMCLDPVRDRVVRHGGYWRHSTGSTGHADTWEWNGASWTRIAGAGTVISRRTAMASDGRDLLLFGGITVNGNANDPLAETAILGRQVSHASNYGTGCSGTAPAVGLAAYGVPRIGNRAFGLTVHDTRPGARCWVGLSTGIAAQPLHGCTILVKPWIGVVTGVSSLAGVCRLPLALPDAPALVGMRFYLQGFVDEPRGAVAGLAFTPGLVLAIGN
ncbi:MAG: hypothetical protein NXI31_24035 [bacterium]|nr:hypothetical protein [bacterium]